MRGQDGLIAHLLARHKLRVRRLPTDVMAGSMRRLDRHRGEVLLDATLDTASQTFQLALQIAWLDWRAEIDTALAEGNFATESGRRLAQRALASYAAAALVMPAISREEGLSYQGAKLLRTRLGEALDNPASLETANISQGELRRIYGALTDDIKSIVDAAGGPAAREALATANALNASVSTLRERLQPLLAGASDESVIAKLASAARST